MQISDEKKIELLMILDEVPEILLHFKRLLLVALKRLGPGKAIQTTSNIELMFIFKH